MTTIAWDGKTLAVDSRMSGAYIISENTQKLWRVYDGWLACCGTYEQVLEVMQWFAGEQKGVKPYSLEDFSAFFLKNGVISLYDGRLIAAPLNAPIAANGTGAKFAMGAMAAGATAAEAVKIAARFDTGTNDRVQVSQ